MSPLEPSSAHLAVTLSQQIATAINAQKNHCASNSWCALIAFPDLFRASGHLVEGWLLIEEERQVVLVEHVWCEREGQIIDPSIIPVAGSATQLWYFPGVARSYAETEALEGELFPHVRFDGLHGPDGMQHPSYKAARDAACRKAYARAQAASPPMTMQFLLVQQEEGSHAMPPSNAGQRFSQSMPLDLAASLALAQTLLAEEGQCWKNARAALLEKTREYWRASYVEGWVVGQWEDTIRLVEHSWIAMPRGEIRDPTMVLNSVLPQQLQYFPGTRLSWLELQSHATRALPLARHYGLNLPAYQEACQHALEAADALAWQTGFPLVIEPGKSVTLALHDSTIQIVEQCWSFPPQP